MHRFPRAVRAMPFSCHSDIQAEQVFYRQIPKAGICTVCSRQQNITRSSLQRHSLAGEQLAIRGCNAMALCQLNSFLESHNAKSHILFGILQEVDQQQAELPTRMNDIPHHRDKRRWFYNEVTQAMLAALADGQTRMRIRRANRLQEAMLCPENMTLQILTAKALWQLCVARSSHPQLLSFLPCVCTEFVACSGVQYQS